MCIMLTSYEHEVEPVTVGGAERAARCAQHLLERVSREGGIRTRDLSVPNAAR